MAIYGWQMTVLVDIFQEHFDRLFETIFEFCDFWLEVVYNARDKKRVELDLQNAVLGEFLDYTEFSMKPWKQKLWGFILRRFLLNTRRIEWFLKWVTKTFGREEDYYDWKKEKAAKELVLNAGVTDYLKQAEEEGGCSGGCNCHE